LKNPSKILIIIQRSNGDVFLSQTLINKIFESYNSPQIDILVNDDTILLAQLLSNISDIHQFSYSKKRTNKWTQEKEIVKKIFRKYDLSISLTASDRSVLYAIFASKKSISSIEQDNKKSWWKKILLTHFYYFDSKKHILLNNLESLNLLKIKHNNIQLLPEISKVSIDRVKNKLKKKGINDFVIFHPSAQYKYKIYSQSSRDELLTYLSSLGPSIVITGSNNKIDSEIKANLPSLPNIYDFIGETSIEECFALSGLSQAYIGMDTLNMHIAASQNKRIFAIFGPTNLSMWSPWSNQLQLSTKDNKPIQTYGNVTIFQANMLCVACGKAGCYDNGISECLYNISPKIVFNEIIDWYRNEGL
jgi:heptosyltransferase III